MGNHEFTNGFAKNLWNALQELKIKSEDVAAQALERKHNLDEALHHFKKYDEVMKEDKKLAEQKPKKQ